MARPKNCKGCKKPKRPKGKEFKDAEGYCECGRPTVMTEKVLGKLEEAFSMAFPDDEACLYAGINPTSLYEYQKKNPKYAQRKEALKKTPNMTARKTVVKALSAAGDAWKWLEKKDADFKPTSKIEQSVEISDVQVERSPEEVKLLKDLQEARRRRIEQNSDAMESPI